MKQCCADLTVKMQEQVELGKWLKLFIAASPFVLMLPDLTPGGSAREVANSIAEKMAVMKAEQVLKNINKGMTKPDFADAIVAVDKIILGTLSQMAAGHIPRHIGTGDSNVWQKLAEAYSPQTRPGGGGGQAGGGSWFPWSWFE